MDWPISCVYGLTLATKVTCKEQAFGYAHLIIRSEYICSKINDNKYKRFGPLGLH